MKRLCSAALVALVVGCHLDRLVGGSGGGSPPPSHGTPVGLAFMTQPQTAQAGQPIGPVKVSIVDSVGHPVAGDTTTVAVTLAANPGGAKLHGDTTAHPVNGVATFTNLWLDNAGNNYTLAASAGNLSGTSTPFNIIPPPPTTGTLNVTTNTTANPPASGYTVSVSNAGSQSIGASQTVTFPGVSPGSHAVALGNVPSNCIVSESNPQNVTITAGQTTSATFTVTCTPPPPTTGDLTVTTSTTGSNLDPDGYTVTVDGNSSTSQTIATNSSTGVTFSALQAGNHSVKLDGVASNCTVSGNNPRTVNVVAGSGGSTAFAVTCTAPPSGSITVTVTTSGPNSPSGYTVTLDAASSQAVGANNSVTFNNVSVGNHSVGLSPIPSNCSVSGANPQTVSITANNTTPASFTVTCSATTGDLVVTTTTGGSNLDPDGYTVSAAGTSQPIPTNGSVTFSNVPAGSQNVALSGIASNCSVTNANPMSVNVPAGGTGHADFAISCAAPVDHAPVVNAGGNQRILIGSFTLNASFTDQDHDGPWSYTIDWDDGGSVTTGSTPSEGGITATHSYGALSTHNVRVTVIDSHLLSGSDTAVISVVVSLAPPGSH